MHAVDTSPRRASHRHFWPPNPHQATTSRTRTTTHRQDRFRVPYAPRDSAQQQPCKCGQSVKLDWCLDADEAFASAKTALNTVATLSFPAPEALTSIALMPPTMESASSCSTDNASADSISRNIHAVSTQSPAIDCAAIAEAQANCDDLQRLLGNPSLKMEKTQVPGTDIRLYADVTIGNLRPFLPQSFRHQLFRHLHNLAHPGIRASPRMLTSNFIWPSINKDVRHWARTCLQCHTSKITRHTCSPLISFLLVSTRSSHVHVDIVSPLPYSNGYKYVFTCVDRFTRWPEAIPLPDINTDTVARAFVENWVTHFGVPTNLFSDRGRQFESTLWNKVVALLGIRRYRTASYHPQANGMVERFHRQLKGALYAHALNNKLWSVALSLVILGIRTSLKVDIGHSPAELVFGTTLRLPGEFVADVPHSNSCTPHELSFLLNETMAKLHPIPPRHAKSPGTFVSQDLLQFTHVFVRTDAVRKALQPPCEGPIEVLRRTRKTVTIKRNGKRQTGLTF
ncbi:uncharacterized protein LOC143018305 [Oratosquilla oratoria]|uniref:uncharacterized protein LOC143018305 n=1 Tax=Oratosquilla oratoria TaxID=337810 RepID=UPI003F76D49F